MADDFQNDPSEQGFPSELDTASPYSGNRPASGARRATPGEVLSQGFQGAENAGDFLGLDTEFTASQDPNQVYAQGGLDLAPLPTTNPDDPQFDPAYAQGVQAPAPLPDSDPVQDFAQAPSAFEFGEDLGSEGEFAPIEKSVASERPLLVGALLVALLGAGGFFYGPTLYSRYFGKKTEVATTTPAQPSTTPARSASVPAKTPAVEPVAAAPASGDEGAVELESATPEPAPVVPRVTPTRAPEPVATSTDADSASEEIESADAPLTASLSSPVSSLSGFPDLGGAEFDWASPDRLELIWRGAEVPLEAVQAPAKTLMPRVGNVRVFTDTGDVFDGRLYAVGQNRVWIDTAPGRVGIDGDRVARIEVLPPLPDGTEASADDALAVGGKRVRVRVPGGSLYGRVVKAEGEDVTLALDAGGRVRVKSSELEDLGPGRAKVVRR